MKKLHDILQIGVFLIPMAAVLAIPAIGQRDISDAENRTLTKLPGFSVQGFLDGSFQDTLEDALSDQYPFSEQVKLGVKGLQNTVAGVQKDMLCAAMPELRSGYVQITDGYYHYANDAHRIVEKPSDRVNDAQALERFAADYRDLDVPVSLYFIENSRVIDFDTPEEGHAVYEAVCEAIAPTASRAFAVTGYEDYCARFYETDHHWNSAGAYEGYCEIIRMLKGDDTELLVPKETITIPVIFNGSYARQTRELCADEQFTLDVFDTPKTRVFINGKKDNYGHRSLYARGKYPDDELRNHYAYCFGGDHAQIVYDTGREGGEDLLIVASSYSNPINELIASHYDKTYVIDLRYYEEWAGAPFDPAAYCAENDIEQVLLLGDVNLFYQSEKAEEEAQA